MRPLSAVQMMPSAKSRKSQRLNEPLMPLGISPLRILMTVPVVSPTALSPDPRIPLGCTTLAFRSYSRTVQHRLSCNQRGGLQSGIVCRKLLERGKIVWGFVLRGDPAIKYVPHGAEIVEGAQDEIDLRLAYPERKKLVYVSSTGTISDLPKGQPVREMDHFDPDKVLGRYRHSMAMPAKVVLLLLVIFIYLLSMNFSPDRSDCCIIDHRC